jgi:putative exporter of polyketide antibiotics
MGAVYWSIPLFIAVIILAVMPVLYGTLKHRQWEETEEASLARAAAAGQLAAPASVPAAALTSHGPSTLDAAREEAMALLVRLEQLRDLFVHDEAAGTVTGPAVHTAD